MAVKEIISFDSKLLDTTSVYDSTQAKKQSAINADTLTALGTKINYTDALTLEEIEASTDLSNKVAAAAAVETLKESLSNWFSIVEQNVSITLSNTSYKNESVTPTAVTGYVPVGVIGYRFGVTGYSMVQLDVRSASLLTVAIEHTNGQAVTGTVTVAIRLLYKKSS